jgi:glyoxylate utilization-related uncharacterized protein
MANTYIDSNTIPRTSLPGAGELAEILNERLAGARNVVATLHWLKDGDRLEVGAVNVHHLVYLMEGEATIRLSDADHRVAKGAGVYVGPSETARVTHAGPTPLKLFHIAVPQL